MFSNKIQKSEKKKAKKFVVFSDVGNFANKNFLSVS